MDPHVRHVQIYVWYKEKDFQLIHFQDYPSFCFFPNSENFRVDYNSKQLLFFDCQGALFLFS